MNSSSPFCRVAIIGVGLIGASFALAFRRQFPGVVLVGFDRPEVLEHALASGIVQHAARDISNAVRGADLIYIALPVIAAMDALPAIAASAAPDALVTDACSTKSAICRVAAGHFRNTSRFLGGHPMAGRELSGLAHAEADLFCGARYVLIAKQADDDARVQHFVGALRAIGAELVYCDAETHDWAAGIVSHLPQMIAVALARVIQGEADETGLPLSLAGGGLRDALRLAGSPYSVWRDICLTNKENISRALDRMSQTLDHLRAQLASKDLEQEFLVANELYKFLRKLQ